jgi:hypothetical protein
MIGDNELKPGNYKMDCSNHVKVKVNVPSEKAKERGRVRRAIEDITEARLLAKQCGDL